MKSQTTGISRLEYLAWIMAIIVATSAFPIYQAAHTGGPIFYTTNVDEASHLAFWYANYIIEDSGRLRESSRLVRTLHQLGISGGYINLLFDTLVSVLIVASVTRLWRRLGRSAESSRLASLVLFTSPLFFSPFNPLVSWINDIRLETSLAAWLSMPNNPELALLRSPEPQLTWGIIAILCAFLSRPFILTGALLVASPLLYPFVRVPIVFTALALLGKRYVGIVWSALLLFILLGVGTLIFSSAYVEPSLRQFFVFSRLPVIPLSGVLALALLTFIKRSLPSHLTTLSTALVTSIWALENVQLVSGWLVTPVNYEQYWGTLVLGFLTTCAVIYRSATPKLWLYVSLAVFFAHTSAIFNHNLSVFGRLESPQNTLDVAKDNPTQLACSDIYLATYLDLAFPHKEPTALSWTRTLSTGTTSEYLSYECVKNAIKSDFPGQAYQFQNIFHVLDNGFVVKGDDVNVSMKRRPIVHQSLPPPNLADCPHQVLILCGKSAPAPR